MDEEAREEHAEAEDQADEDLELAEEDAEQVSGGEGYSLIRAWPMK